MPCDDAIADLLDRIEAARYTDGTYMPNPASLAVLESLDREADAAVARTEAVAAPYGGHDGLLAADRSDEARALWLARVAKDTVACAIKPRRFLDGLRDDP